MKKFLSMLLILAMIFTLTSCFGDTDEDIRGDIVNSGTEADETKNVAEDAEPEFSLGTSSGGAYHSDFVGLTITVPSEWMFYSDEEILALNNITEGYYDESTLEIIKNASLVYDMFAQNPLDGSSITVVLEKLNVLQIAALDYKAIIENQYAAMRTTYENMGLTNIELSYDKVVVDGEEIDAMVISADIYGLEYNAYSLMFRRGSYLVSIAVGAFGSDSADNILTWLDFE